jgi:hypothetical protein
VKGFTGILTAAALCTLFGAAVLVAGFYQQEMAAADQGLLTQQYDDARGHLHAAELWADHGRWIPPLVRGALADVRTRQAAADYWQQRYDAVLPRQGDPVGAVDADNPELQLIVAHAAFRAGQSQATDRASSMQALDEAIAAYTTVLKGETWSNAAAYDYEFLMRARDELAKGRGKTASVRKEKNSNLGQAGQPAPSSADSKKFQIYVPLDGRERTKSGEAGKSSPIQRKG